MDNSGDRLYVGVDVGGTKILSISAEPAVGVIHQTVRSVTPRHGQVNVADAITRAVEELWIDGVTAGIGVGLPGLVDHRGVLRYGPNLPGILDLDMAGVLGERFGVPVAIENDASNAALAEHRLGAARGATHAVIITQGTGIGGALIIGGQLLRGANGFAAEPGHMLINEGGHRCACGMLGCWESVASGTGLANVAREIVAEGRGQRVLELAGGEAAHVRGEHVSAAWAEGDAGAIEIIERFIYWVAQGLGSLVTLLDPEIIVLGGGLAAINDRFIGDVQAQIMRSAIGGSHRPVVPVVPAQMGEAAGAMGAALSARDLAMEA